MDLSNLKEQAKKAESANKKLVNKLKKSKPKSLDNIVQDLHDEAFEKIDCLQCANCCKTTSPIFYQKDIERISKHLKLRPSDFIDKYLHIDEDKDYVLNSAPCPFLGNDNYCSVYEARPNACREYPHTDRKRFYQLLDLTLKNTSICPAAFQIVEKLKDKFN
jgi:Fe-S-cluster containining protein